MQRASPRPAATEKHLRWRQGSRPARSARRRDVPGEAGARPGEADASSPSTRQPHRKPAPTQSKGRAFSPPPWLSRWGSPVSPFPPTTRVLPGWLCSGRAPDRGPDGAGTAGPLAAAAWPLDGAARGFCCRRPPPEVRSPPLRPRLSVPPPAAWPAAGRPAATPAGGPDPPGPRQPSTGAVRVAVSGDRQSGR